MVLFLWLVRVVPNTWKTKKINKDRRFRWGLWMDWIIGVVVSCLAELECMLALLKTSLSVQLCYINHMTLCSDKMTDFTMEPRNNEHKRRDHSGACCLTLTVFPRRPPQKGLIILDIENTALWAAILMLKGVAACARRRSSCARAMYIYIFYNYFYFYQWHIYIYI